jgi:hypothetical protein
MKAVDILKEEGKKAGIEAIEKALSEVLELLEAAAPRLANEADEQAAKIVGSGLVMILPVLKPALLKVIDLDKDGQIG